MRLYHGAPKVMPPHRLIDDEVCYPIYSFRVRMSRLRREGVGSGLPDDPTFPGRFIDFTTGSKMFEEVLEPRELERQKYAWRQSLLARYPDAIFYAFSAVLTHWETWVCTWFSHYTFPRGRSDQELLESFNRYVNRHERYAQIYGEDLRQLLDPETEAVCLMGAEDRWRWRDSADDYDHPICRCAGCASRGVVTINH